MLCYIDRHYYSIAINYRKSDLEQKMLLSLERKKWTNDLTLVITCMCIYIYIHILIHIYT